MNHERGLRQLRKLSIGTTWFQEFLNFESRLLKALTETRQHGTTEQLRNEISKVETELNALSLNHLPIDFNYLCQYEYTPPLTEAYPSFEIVKKAEIPNEGLKNVSIPQSTVTNNLIQPSRKIFISYTSRDRTYLDELRGQVAESVKGGIACWDDEEIHPVTVWRREREKALQEAKLVILFVSQNYLKSDFLLHHELPYLFSTRTKQLSILSIIVRPCSFHESKFARFETANSPLQPLSSMNLNERYKLWMQVSEKINYYLQSN